MKIRNLISLFTRLLISENIWRIRLSWAFIILLKRYSDIITTTNIVIRINKIKIKIIASAFLQTSELSAQLQKNRLIILRGGEFCNFARLTNNLLNYEKNFTFSRRGYNVNLRNECATTQSLLRTCRNPKTFIVEMHGASRFWTEPISKQQIGR